MFQKLWGRVPVFITNLLEGGHVNHEFNKNLTKAALDAFQHYMLVHRQSSDIDTNVTISSSNNNKRRRRVRTKKDSVTSSLTDDNATSVNNHLHSIIIPKESSTTDTDTITNNDYFFQHQRIRGYHLSSPALTHSLELSHLREELIINATINYLAQVHNIDHDQNSNQFNHYSKDSHSNSLLNILSEGIQTGMYPIDIWATVLHGTNSYHRDHVHEGAFLSGVYYASTPHGSSQPLILRRPSTHTTFTATSKNIRNNNENDKQKFDAEQFVIEPTEGTLVIFPPWIVHGVPPMKSTLQSEIENESLLPRISFAFNVHGDNASLGEPW
eukprot:CAMPEP_0184864986 /NCGR_PEP_ID=MMETSP0580-20130426/16550_1 /TAXON_ID=1118495 /ORGANISM="Dactyliosolen fragilissimus" /LENGTH=326 /DNA_ID=CAMNT_0027363971 /DNA_START=381 /DNA_END=1358 /DNA_ORIENTATION=-